MKDVPARRDHVPARPQYGRDARSAILGSGRGRGGSRSSGRRRGRRGGEDGEFEDLAADGAVDGAHARCGADARRGSVLLLGEREG